MLVTAFALRLPAVGQPTMVRKPPTGPFPELGRLARIYSGDASTRAIENKVESQFSHGTAARLLNGEVMTESTLFVFASAYKKPLNPLRVAMGLAPLDFDPITGISADPLAALGEEIDPTTFTSALADIQLAGAVPEGVVKEERWPYHAAPGETVELGPVRAKRIVGDCMEPVLYDGDVILFTTKAEDVRDGDLVIALVDMEHVVCKLLRITPDTSWLEPMNGDQIIPENRFTIAGIVRRIDRDPIRDLQIRGRLP